MKKYFSLILLFLPLSLPAQITAPGNNAVRYTNYPSGGAEHPIFIYCGSSGSEPQLQAVSPGGTGPYDFAWTRWDEAANSFSISLGSDPGQMISSRTSLDEGGYRVRITDGGGYDVSLVAWIHIDMPVSEISLEQSICEQVTLRGRALPDEYYYEDLSTGDPVLLPNAVEFVYSSSPESLIGNPTFHTYNIADYGLKVLGTPPLEDVDYIYTVTDSFSCSSVSSFFYESIHVKADFELDPSGGEAPLEVFITDKSIRASDYTWRFGDNTLSNDINPVSHTYYKPGIYAMSLTIESDLGCVDSMIISDIVVDPSSINIPNVFTPDGDGINEYFVVESASLRYISVQVFSKSGLRVYSFTGEGDSLKDWQGWDGKIGASKASPGIYYYVIKARGWDDVIYDGKEYRGFFYLYR
ncbi:MAG: gliding motility-associated C-terminal domain-containing protein [Marinilabiliaceae bacterium]|nr:gliding motility-associated C-terminal domain-containing protein [Marinilabiliaceae bacterium]